MVYFAHFCIMGAVSLCQPIALSADVSLLSIFSATASGWISGFIVTESTQATETFLLCNGFRYSTEINRHSHQYTDQKPFSLRIPDQSTVSNPRSTYFFLPEDMTCRLPADCYHKLRPRYQKTMEKPRLLPGISVRPDP